MQQYFINEKVQEKQRIKMSLEQAHHIAHVMRMKEGAQIRLSDFSHTLFMASIHYEQKEVYAVVEERIEDHTRNVVKITLLQGLIKKEKWDFLLQKSGELGVDKIVPFISSRTVIKNKEERLEKKMLRWNKILLEACEQCKRSSLVELCEPCSLEHAMMENKSELNLIAYEDADTIGEKLCTLLQQYPSVSSITLAIGCEGGFSSSEVAMFLKQGYQVVSLGSRILRAETAALSSISSISFYYDMIHCVSTQKGSKS